MSRNANQSTLGNMIERIGFFSEWSKDSLWTLVLVATGTGPCRKENDPVNMVCTFGVELRRGGLGGGQDLDHGPGEGNWGAGPFLYLLEGNRLSAHVLQ